MAIKKRRTTYAIGCLVLLTFFATTALAQKKSAKKKPGNEVHQKLESNQSKEVAKAIQLVKKSKRPKDVRALLDRIRNGLPLDLLNLAIDALVAIGGKAADGMLIELAHHRSHMIREKIASGLASSPGPGAMNALKKLLDDQVPKVRSEAITAIGKRGAKPAMNELLEAAKRGIPEAIDIVAKQAAPNHVTRLTKTIDDNNVLLLAPILQEFVRRKNIPKGQKLAIIKRLESLATLNAMAQLRLYAAGLPQKDPVRQAAAKALERVEQASEKEEK